MSLYSDYLAEIESRKAQGLAPKPIDDWRAHRRDHRRSSDAASPNTAPTPSNSSSTTPCRARRAPRGVKAAFLKEIILGEAIVPEITPLFALELLSHMKGGPSIGVLLDVTLGSDACLATQAGEVLKTQFFLYDADMFRLRDAYKAGNAVAKDVLESYAKAEFFTKLPDVADEIKVVTFVAAEGDISTDLLSPGNQAHSRADRELHGQCMMTPQAQAGNRGAAEAAPRQARDDDRREGHDGRGLSRMSGVNNVALWTGKPASPYVPFVNFAPIVAGTNGISPIFAHHRRRDRRHRRQPQELGQEARRGRQADPQQRRQPGPRAELTGRYRHRPDASMPRARSCATKTVRSWSTSLPPSRRRRWSS